MSTPHIQTYVLGDYETNCFVVTPGDPQPGAPCWIVDCGFEPEPLLDAIEHGDLRPQAILLTHAHPDHIAGVDAARARLGDVPVYLHEAERGFCNDPMRNLSALMGMPVTCAEPDHWLQGGDTLELDGTTWDVIAAPGHSPGGVIYLHRPSNQAIVGDTLFAGSMGRVDFPTSDAEAMHHTITEVIMGLPDEVTIHPGHGASSTIGVERQTNPFVLAGRVV